MEYWLTVSFILINQFTNTNGYRHQFEEEDYPLPPRLMKVYIQSKYAFCI